MTDCKINFSAYIWNCLNHYSYIDATFLAERLWAENSTSDNYEEYLYLLATCYYRSDKKHQAYYILKNRRLTRPECKFLLAKCCVDLKKLEEAETTLFGNDLSKIDHSSWVTSEYGEEAAFVLQLIGDICFKTERHELSAKAHERALKVNPFLWSSFSNLCDQGLEPDPDEIYPKSSDASLELITSALTQPSIKPSTIQNKFATTPLAASPISTDVKPAKDTVKGVGVSHFTPTLDANKPFTEIPPPVKKSNFNSVKINKKLSESTYTPMSFSPSSFGVQPLDVSTPNCSVVTDENMIMECDEYAQKFPKKRVASQTKDISTPFQLKPILGNSSIVPVRRSNRNVNNTSGVSSLKQNTKSAIKHSMAKSPGAKSKVANIAKAKNDDTPNNATKEKETERCLLKKPTLVVDHFFEGAKLAGESSSDAQDSMERNIINVIRQIGVGYVNVQQYRCKEALIRFNELPRHHLNTSYVMGLCGKACVDLNEYKSAEKHFALCRELDPFQDRMMDLYSSTLWLLDKKTELAALADSLLILNSNSPTTWCAVGNNFSLQKEHELAVKFFKRAIACDDTHYYAYTLLGHEYVVLEKHDKAWDAYRTAVRIFPRHYNAWYGMGTIYMREENLRMAEVQFRKALRIFPTSAEIMCHLSVVMQKIQGQANDAMRIIRSALIFEPKNPLCKYHRAFLNFTMGNYAEALEECEEVIILAPKEAIVYYLIARIHKKLSNDQLALMNLSCAIDLDKKGSNHQMKLPAEPLLSNNTTVDLSLSSAMSSGDPRLSAGDDRYFSYRRRSSDSSSSSRADLSFPPGED